jgi:hypothetical protein
MTRTTTRRPSRIRQAVVAAALSATAVGAVLSVAAPAHAYVPRITEQDLIDAHAQLITGGYTIGGRTYHCPADPKGYCSIA